MDSPCTASIRYGRESGYTVFMKNLVIIGTLCVLALLVGGLLYWRTAGTEQGTSAVASTRALQGEDVSFRVLGKGDDAKAMPERKNYAIYDAIEFANFWKKAHGDDGKGIPLVDFSKNYVIAVFAGTVPSGGYSISVSKVTDTGNARSVAVVIEQPGEDCNIIQEETHPYQFIVVPSRDTEALSHTDILQRKACAGF
jgi:hypothetical protein